MKNLKILEEFEGFELCEVGILDEYERLVRTRFIVMKNGTRVGSEFETIDDAKVLFEQIKKDQE